MTPWVIHDLRRSVATHMAEKLDIDPHIIEAVLNHVGGHKRGVAGVYNKATYERRKRDALDRWGTYVEAALGPATLPARCSSLSFAITPRSVFTVTADRSGICADVLALLTRTVETTCGLCRPVLPTFQKQDAPIRGSSELLRET
jgi:hypothetical protein